MDCRGSCEGVRLYLGSPKNSCVAHIARQWRANRMVMGMMQNNRVHELVHELRRRRGGTQLMLLLLLLLGPELLLAIIFFLILRFNG